MKKLLYYSAIIMIASFSVKSIAQTTYSAQDQIRAINKHFLGDQLQGIAQYEQERYSAIQFYFKSSFSVSLIECPACEVDMDEFYTTSQFDIVDFESQRLVDNTVEIEFKEKYKILLLSKNDLNEQINYLELSVLLSRKVNRPFPTWNSEYSQSDFALYAKLVREWERDFPDEFKAMYYSEGFEKVKFSEFQQLSEMEQNEILTNHAGYLLLKD